MGLPGGILQNELFPKIFNSGEDADCPCEEGRFDSNDSTYKAAEVCNLREKLQWQRNRPYTALN